MGKLVVPACMRVAMGREGHGLDRWLCGLRERRNSEQTAGHRKAERHRMFKGRGSTVVSNYCVERE